MFANPLDEYEMSIPLSAFAVDTVGVGDNETMDKIGESPDAPLSEPSLAPSSPCRSGLRSMSMSIAPPSPSPSRTRSRSMSPVSPPLPRRPNLKVQLADDHNRDPPDAPPAVPQSALGSGTISGVADGVPLPTPQASPVIDRGHDEFHDQSPDLVVVDSPQPKFSSLSGLTEAKLSLYVHCILPPPAPSSPPPFIIIHGPPGTGKTSLARCLAGEKR